MYVEEIMGMGPPVFRCDLAMLCLTGLAVERCSMNAVMCVSRVAGARMTSHDDSMRHGRCTPLKCHQLCQVSQLGPVSQKTVCMVWRIILVTSLV